MAILERELKSRPSSTVDAPRRHLFSRADYYSMAIAGILVDQRVELIEGEVIDMAPVGDWHAALTHPMSVLLEQRFGPGFSARNQGPISLGDSRRPSEPQPDITIVIGKWQDFGSRKPRAKDVALVVEISESSLTYDRTAKAALYAAAGIVDYWIVNLVDNQLEVYREPADAEYGSTTIYRRGETVVPLLAPNATFAVTDFLP